ncbi:CmcJ/NvfI family oxidoreductase [Ramlibacter pallidus]|uniref:Methyltransferase n=1 Tax=Ramlibacter pallidus TaxID=2780087 RepID=A0ABR9S104_9BURK|nr:CmcJ/NvfI family oxidoreductase [Ramlibacter pallidus]MBE7367171.1 methyltransferase [Ramlibacter pallidus]
MAVAVAAQRSTFADPNRPPVHAALSYVVRSASVPRSYTYPPPAGEPWESADFDRRTVRIADGRRHPGATSVHREGFELWDAPSAVSDFLDHDAVTGTYYAECAELALAATGAARAYVFDHLLRRREPDGTPLTFGRPDQGRAGANGRIHNDYTEASGRRRLGLVVTDPAERAAVRRYSIVNIWRPIRGPVLDAPLAVCDARTVAADDLVTAEVLYPRRTGEIYFVAHSPGHRWTFFSGMDRHEALVFKQFDSAQDVARFTPHSAFDHPHTPPGTPPRESIELRCLVVYD